MWVQVRVGQGVLLKPSGKKKVRKVAQQTIPVKLTERAVKRVQQLMARQGDPDLILRIGVRAGGCAGLEYVLKLEKEVKPQDQLYEVEGVKVVMDPKSAQLLEGTTLDYTGELLGSGFRFHNPRAKRSCGCGTSFSPI